MIQWFKKQIARQTANRLSPNRLSREEGAIMPLAAAAAATFLLLFIIMVLEQGTLFAGRTQLQHAADAGARGALMRASQMALEQGMEGAELLTEARSMAFAAIKGGTIIATDPDRRDFTVELGNFEVTSDGKKFVPVSDVTALIGPPQAARVTASPQGGFGALFSSRVLNASAVAVASYPCLNIAITTDASISFVDNESDVKNGIESAIHQIYARPNGGGGELSLVGFAGQDLDTNGVTAGGVSPRFSLTNPNDETAAVDYIRSLQFCSPRELNPAQLDACLGTDMQSGLEEAREELLAANNECINMIVLLSDGEPCELIGGRGSSRSETRAEAARAQGAGISIAPIFLNQADDQAVPCPNTTPILFSLFSGPRQSDRDYLQSLASGYGTLLDSGFQVDEIASNIQEALVRVPPVLVE